MSCVTAADDEPLVPERSDDDSDGGWSDGARVGERGDAGERGDVGERDDDFYRRERPPHHGG